MNTIFKASGSSELSEKILSITPSRVAVESSSGGSSRGRGDSQNPGFGSLVILYRNNGISNKFDDSISKSGGLSGEVWTVTEEEIRSGNVKMKAFLAEDSEWIEIIGDATVIGITSTGDFKGRIVTIALDGGSSICSFYIDSSGNVVGKVVNGQTTIGEPIIDGIYYVDYESGSSRGLFKSICNLGSKIVNAIIDAASFLKDLAVTIVEAGFEFLKNGISWIVDKAKAAWNWMKEWVENRVKDMFNKVVNPIIEKIKGYINGIENSFNEFCHEINKFDIVDGDENVEKVNENAVAFILSFVGLQEKAESLMNILEKIMKFIKPFMKFINPIKVIELVASKIPGLSDIYDTITGFVKYGVKKITSLFIDATLGFLDLCGFGDKKVSSGISMNAITNFIDCSDIFSGSIILSAIMDAIKSKLETLSRKDDEVPLAGAILAIWGIVLIGIGVGLTYKWTKGAMYFSDLIDIIFTGIGLLLNCISIFCYITNSGYDPLFVFYASIIGLILWLIGAIMGYNSGKIGLEWGIYYGITGGTSAMGVTLSIGDL